MNRIPQPTITTGELTLRPWTEGDIDVLVQAYQDPVIQRWHVRSLTTVEAGGLLRRWIGKWGNETGAEWAVEFRGQVVGRCALTRIDLAIGQGEAAFWVLPEARGSGHAPAALQAVTDWMLTHIGMNRIELEHSVHNASSCRVAVKSGYLPEGIKQRSGLHADGWHDMHLHARLNDRPGVRPHRQIDREVNVGGPYYRWDDSANRNHKENNSDHIV